MRQVAALSAKSHILRSAIKLILSCYSLEQCLKDVKLIHSISSKFCQGINYFQVSLIISHIFDHKKDGIILKLLKKESCRN